MPTKKRLRRFLSRSMTFRDTTVRVSVAIGGVFCHNEVNFIFFG